MGKKHKRQPITNLTAKVTTRLPKKPAIPRWISSVSSIPHTAPLRGLPKAPKVFYTDTAWAKIQYLIHNCPKEVGWMGLAELRPTGNYLIEDIFVPEQEVQAAETDISAHSLNRLLFQLVQAGKDPTKLLYWGHSHVNMMVSPSIQDEEMIQTFVEGIPEGAFFIRGIYNKSGDSKVDVYTKPLGGLGWIFQCVENGIVPRTLTDETREAMKELIAQNVKVKVLPLPVNTYKGNTPYRGYNPKSPAEAGLLEDLDDAELHELLPSWSLYP
jgi:hypothetical protein